MDASTVGLEFLRILWIRTAEKVVEKAIQVYQLDSEQAEALRKVFLKPNHYYTLSN
jgi:hypothetical protein